MIYTTDRKQEILDSGNYRNLQYIIVSHGTHPCCYVALPKWHKFYNQPYERIDSYVSGIHGGLTYGSFGLKGIFDNESYWVIGWDYAHYGDYLGYYDLLVDRSEVEKYKKWTTLELIAEVKKVIDELLTQGEK